MHRQLRLAIPLQSFDLPRRLQLLHRVVPLLVGLLLRLFRFFGSFIRDAILLCLLVRRRHEVDDLARPRSHAGMQRKPPAIRQNEFIEADLDLALRRKVGIQRQERSPASRNRLDLRDLAVDLGTHRHDDAVKRVDRLHYTSVYRLPYFPQPGVPDRAPLATAAPVGTVNSTVWGGAGSAAGFSAAEALRSLPGVKCGIMGASCAKVQPAKLLTPMVTAQVNERNGKKYARAAMVFSAIPQG